MLRFRIGSIPIEVHFSHVALSAMFGLMFAQGSRKETWPGSELASPGTAGYYAALSSVVALWVGIVFVSVLVHELGHALTYRAFGRRPTIKLIGLGGATAPDGGPALAWHKDLAMTLAGPFAGFLLFLVALVGSRFVPPSWTVARAALEITYFANAWWTVLNLLPVPPLDGGRVSLIVLTRLFGRTGFVLAQVGALLVSGGVALFGALTQSWFVAIFFGLYAMRAIQALSAHARSGADEKAAPSPAQATLDLAADLYRAGKLDQARQVALGVLETDLPPALSGTAHYLLGWVALKQGEGRRALDHFSQVQGKRIEPHGLAAAFSLIGDETRALPLWELSARETGDRTILHEFAGALIRAGRVEEARRLPQVDLLLAYACAIRVLFLRGDFREAARAGEESLALKPRAEVAYDTACAYARAGSPDDAVRLLQAATELGFANAEYAESDEDLGALRNHPAFHAWLRKMRKTARA